MPLEKVKHGRKPDGRYYPGEAGESPAVPLIEQTLRTWVGSEHTETVPRAL